MDEFCGSPFWNTNITWVTDDPDFTSCFQWTVLSWIPCILLWVFLPLEIYYIRNSRYSNIPWNTINVFRLFITILLFCLSTAELGLGFDLRKTPGLYDVHIITPIIQMITFILTIILAHFHKKRGVMSSGLMFHFWLILCIFAIPQFRSEIKQFEGRENSLGSDHQQWVDRQFLIYMMYFPLTVIQFLAHCIADRPPQSSTYNITNKENSSSPENYVSFIRKVLFIWYDSFIWKGYKKPLEITDLYDLNPQDTSQELVPPFDKYWIESVEKSKKKEIRVSKVDEKPTSTTSSRRTKGSILPAMFKAYGGPFMFGGVLKLLIDLLSFASPFVLSSLIDFISSDDPIWQGILFSILLFGISALSGLLNGQYLCKSFLVGFRIRTALISAIYRKSLTISNAAKKDTTVGEVVNLMSVDAQRFFELIQYLHIIWTGPIIAILAIYFLWQILGIAVISGLCVMILLIPFNGYVANKLQYLQRKQMKKKDERVKLMNEILSGIKALKLYAWESSFEDLVHTVRDKEMQIIRNTAFFNAIIYFTWTVAPYFVTLASFVTYVLIDEKNVIDAKTAFVSLSLFNVLRSPLTLMPMTISLAMQGWVSIVRINKYLNNEDLVDEIVTHHKDENAIKIDNAEFSWGVDEFSLKNINFNIKKNGLVAVVGTVGSGKSTLVHSILGETEKLKGSINTDGSMAYVPQQAWIENATLRENILFGKPFDSKFYDKVLDACALTADIAMLPGGDKTEIGEKGINLSGGQKQRVSLARAVYSNADIMLLDDPLSAVDSHVGKHIFDNVIGPHGILSRKTRLLVTHGITYLPNVETIYVLNDGEITESGPYSKLIEQKGAFADFIFQHLQEIAEDDEVLSEIRDVLNENTTGSQIFQRALSTISITVKRRPTISSMESLPRGSILQLTNIDETTLIQKEESATGSVGLGVYLRYFKSVGSFYVTMTIVASIAYQAFSVYANTWLAEWASDEESIIPAIRDKYLGVYGALGFLQAIALLASALAIAIGCLNAASTLHNKLLHQSMRLPMSFFDTTPLGRIMNRFSKDTDVVDNTLPLYIRLWILMFASVVAIFVIISVSTPIFMTVIIPLGIIYFFIQSVYVATSRQLKRMESVTRSPIYSHFGETITGQSTIRAYGVQQRFINDSNSKVDLNQQCSYPSIIATRWLGVRLETIGSLVILFAALFAVFGRDVISGATVGLSVSYALQITQMLNYVVRTTAEIETNIVANERMEEYCNLKTEVDCVTKPANPLWPTEGEVKFDNYKVRYRDHLELVLKGITFIVKGGEKVGIVGRTGAGKSSLTLGLFRIIEAVEGSITIDGLNIAGISLQSLRSRLTIIPQDPVLFSGTLRINIDPFNKFSDDQIWSALEHSHLKAFVKGSPNGLNYAITEGGQNLSLGQRQLVCLARALLRKTKVLIMDEATAAVDLETDDLIQKTIRTQFSDSTILTIAHRLNTILDSEKVLVLDKGEVAEFDTPKRLLDNKKSIFYNMAKDAGIVA